MKEILKEGKSPDRFKWEKIIFTDLKPETDVFIYRQMCEMLIPQKECTNRFRIKATGEMTDFYIGSNDLLSLRFMKSFFSRLYSLKYEEEKESVEEVKVFNLYRLTSYRIDGPIMVPSLLQNIAFMHNVAENDVYLDVAIYHHRGGKAEDMLSKEGIFVSPGKYFGIPTGYRLCITSSPDQFRKDLEKLCEYHEGREKS